MRRINNIKPFLFLLLTFLMFLPVSALAEKGHEGEEKLNVKEVVFEHLADAYDWHIYTLDGHHVSIPLLIIVKGNSGWQTFSSSRLAHGESFNGFYIAEEGDYAGKIVEKNSAGEIVRPLDISITKNVATLLINSVFVLLIILPLARWYKRKSKAPPKGFLGFVEMLIVSIQEDVIKACIGEDYKRYSPYLLTAFFFILFSNMMGLIPFFPGGANLTGNIAITFFLAFCTFLAVNLNTNKHYWKEIFWPDVPMFIKYPIAIMPLVEIIGVISKPFALMVRLFANIMAGHSMVIGLICVIFITSTMGAATNTSMSVVAVIFSIFINCIELLVAYIQAYVFTLLSAVFIGLARAKH